jgi:hypothetical protein
MLGASLCMLVVVSAFVAFGSWPGQSSGKRVDQVLLNDVVRGAKPKAVSVRTDAVKVARRVAARRQVALAKRQQSAGGRSTDTKVAKIPGATVAPTSAAGTPVAAAPKGGADSPVNTVRQQTQDATKTLDSTTQTVTNQVQSQVDQTTTQVDQVVDQVVGGVQQQANGTVDQVQSTVTNTTGAVQNTAGGLLGH